MKQPVKNTLLWTPRIIAVLFILFVSVFALDVWGEKDWLPALIFHLIPSYFLIFFTVIAWKNERLGGILFIMAGLAFMLVSRFEGYVVSIPAIILGFLFFLSAQQKNHT